MLHRILIATILLSATAHAAELPPGAIVLDPDIVWDLTKPNAFAISPDGKQIAYISKGALWACNLTNGPPTKLTSLPNSMTELLAEPANRVASRDPKSLAWMLLAWGRLPAPERPLRISSLEWTRTQDGVTYSAQNWIDERSTITRFFHASASTATSEIASIKSGPDGLRRDFTSFHPTTDRTVVVASIAGGHPLIWDAITNKPRATSFDFLTPSETSDRFLGVEIDTRQLVLADEHFQIVKRFDVTFAQDRRCEVLWSPDEKHAFCRSFDEHLNNWEGVRIDLESGARRRLAGRTQYCRIDFTGNGGEMVWSGLVDLKDGWYADGRNGTFIAILPDGDGAQQDIFRFRRPPRRSDEKLRGAGYPPIIGNRDASLFAIALPRDDEPLSGYDIFLVDRTGRRWRCPIPKATEFIATLRPLAFSGDGQTLVARSESQLISLSVVAIQSLEPNDAESTDD